MFDNRVTVKKNLIGNFEQCYGCRIPITKKIEFQILQKEFHVLIVTSLEQTNKRKDPIQDRDK